MRANVTVLQVAVTRFHIVCLATTLAACGGGGDAPAPEPTAPGPAAVASVSIAPDTASTLPGGTVQYAATTRDASGSALTGRAVTWSTSNAAVATVNGSGLVTTITPGTVTITATSETRAGTASVLVVDPRRMPVFSRPFAAGTSYVTTNLFDHDVPRAFFDNGRMVSFWNERYGVIGYEGHEGYDWRMAEGNAMLAVADGIVTNIVSPSFVCPLLGTTIPADGNGEIVIEHALPGGVRVRTIYAHLSRRDVRPGDRVTAGQQIGLSGGVGCSLQPHLHFGVQRLTQTASGRLAIIDPYGWEGTVSDPWLADANGAESITLWKPGEAPELFARSLHTLNFGGGTAFFGVTTVQMLGVRDSTTPNNEYIDITRDARFAPATVDLTGATIRTKAGTVYTLAASSLTAANPTVRVYSGSGTNSASTLYMGRSAGVYDNVNECVEVFNSSGALRHRAGWGTGCSP
jgi:murein DD-endopeptidase MepM/ murein hydrolase activator NlpD